MSDREPDEDLVFYVINYNKEPNPTWHARVIAYRSPTGLVDHMSECLEVVEVGREQDVKWAVKQVRSRWPRMTIGAYAR